MWGKWGITSLGMLLTVSVSSDAYAQAQAVQQSGAVTAGHSSAWVYNGVIQDSGTANVGNITELGITKNGGRPFCISDTKVRTGVYYQLCEGISSAGGYITLDSFGGGTAPPFSIIINGTAYPFPSSVPYAASPLRSVTSGTTDTVLSADQNGVVVWNSNSSSPKTQTLFACTSLLNGYNVTIKDEIGTAGSYPITVSSASNIDGQASFIMAFNYQSVTFRCDGSTTHWVIT